MDNITLYTKQNCKHCTKAKKLLATSQIPFLEQKLDVHFTREHLKQLFPDAATYPIIVINGFNIGGAKELEEMLIEQHKDTTQLLNEG
jgi:glutaredoxin